MQDFKFALLCSLDCLSCCRKTPLLSFSVPRFFLTNSDHNFANPSGIIVVCDDYRLSVIIISSQSTRHLNMTFSLDGVNFEFDFFGKDRRFFDCMGGGGHFLLKIKMINPCFNHSHHIFKDIYV